MCNEMQSFHRIFRGNCNLSCRVHVAYPLHVHAELTMCINTILLRVAKRQSSHLLSEREHYKTQPFREITINSTELRIRINAALNRLSLAWSAQDRRNVSGCVSLEHTARSVRPRDLCKAKVPNPRLSDKRKGDLTPVKLLRYVCVCVIDVCVRMYTYCILLYLQYLTIISTYFIQVRAMIYIQKSLKHPKATWRGSGPTGNNFLN